MILRQGPTQRGIPSPHAHPYPTKSVQMGCAHLESQGCMPGTESGRWATPQTGGCQSLCSLRSYLNANSISGRSPDPRPFPSTVPCTLLLCRHLPDGYFPHLTRPLSLTVLEGVEGFLFYSLINPHSQNRNRHIVGVQQMSNEYIGRPGVHFINICSLRMGSSGQGRH